MTTERDELTSLILGRTAPRAADAVLAAGYRKVTDTALDRVREIHAPIDAVMFAGGRQHSRQVCTGCGTDDGNWQIWPCPTIRAMEGGNR